MVVGLAGGDVPRRHHGARRPVALPLGARLDADRGRQARRAVERATGG